MSLVSILRLALFLLVPTSLISTFYLHAYPIFHGCAFPLYDENRQHSSSPVKLYSNKKIAPFRLLVLGDPQLEGDSSISNIEATKFPNLKVFFRHLQQDKSLFSLQTIRLCLHDLIDFYLDDIPKALRVWHKRLDHIGNDYYLGHIYTTLHWWTNPTHVAVLGDLIGSQWVNDEEFERRGLRYWNRVFRGGTRVPSEELSHTIVLGEDRHIWSNRIINIAGNHDIGYAGDMSSPRLLRFAKIYGNYNYELRFEISKQETEGLVMNSSTPTPELRVIILNDMNLDVPAGSKELQDETYNFLNSIITSSSDVDRMAHFTLLLTHIPLFKEEGICTDGPYFQFYEDKYNNGIKEQYLLSLDASKGILEGIFGLSGKSNAAGKGYGRNGVILNGHDHEGCDVIHYINQSSSHEPQWESQRWSPKLSSEIKNKSGLPNLREITLRSMMGAYDGNAGLMSLWYDEEKWEWRFEFVNCRFGQSHVWWIIHVVDFITLTFFIFYGVLVFAQKIIKSPKMTVLYSKDKNRVSGGTSQSMTLHRTRKRARNKKFY